MKKLLFTTTVLLIFLINLHSQPINIDARVKVPEIKTGLLKMGNPGPRGKQILLNNKYITLDGQPIIPVMGEMHYTRIKRENWEDTILKMKANGINIIAYYIFWIHHEEIEGEFNWTGNHDLRAFTELCKKHNIWAYPRLGPWCHGEVRNGGLPDWLMKNNLQVRTNDPAYQFYAERLYKEIAHQLDGLYYKDGGPIIGVQLENEYWRGKDGESHILWLKKTAQKYGIDVPMYTVTAWRRASLPEYEVVPLWGGYPAAPWNTDLNKIEYNESYLFTKPLNDESIGHKGDKDVYQPDYSPYPYLTCELGVGNQLSEHRRPIIDPIDGRAIATSSIASGSNLPGYYVFAGGLNPVGKLTTLEEDRWESGYWNEYPDISYDFQAAISDAGEIKPSYHELKALHYFLNDFGNLLAPMQPVIPGDNENWDDLQYSFRTDGSSGFLFVSNYYRGHTKSTKKEVQFDIQLKDETKQIPQLAIDISDSTIFIWPVNLKMGDALLKYATCQLVCNYQEGNTTTWIFIQNKNIVTEYLLAKENIAEVMIDKKVINSKDEDYFIQIIKPGLNSFVRIKTKDGNYHKIICLTENQGKNFWYFDEKGKEYAFLSTANLIMDDKQQIYALSTNPQDNIIPLNCELGSHSKLKKKNIDTSQQWDILHPQNEDIAHIQKADLINVVQFLKINPEKYNEKKSMYHKQFFNEFILDNTAEIRKAGIYLLSGLPGRIRINNRWLNQSFNKDQINYLDLSGYLLKGENKLLFDFPYSIEKAVLGAAIEVEYYNSDKEYILTDSTWSTIEQYKIPTPWENVRDKKPPIVNQIPDEYSKFQFTPNRYEIALDIPTQKTNDKVYLRINYTGNKAQCRLGERLIADNFNNGTTWTINLGDLNPNNRPLIFELEPWNGQGIYLEGENDRVMNKKAELNKCWVKTEDRVTFTIH